MSGVMEWVGGIGKAVRGVGGEKMGCEDGDRMSRGWGGGGGKGMPVICLQYNTFIYQHT